MTQRRLVLAFVVMTAVLPYVQTLDDYFVQDDFGVVWLLSTKPAAYFPHWFVIPWMENIWGDPPDEIRPFPAVTYQVAALWGAASPLANHAINVGFHAVNTVFVLRVAEMAAGLSLGPAAFAAAVFAMLPMQSESVAWVTGRVDSMPACFYLLSFLLYVRWRAGGRQSLYLWSVVACFVALFTKQNTVTLVVALVLYDFVVARRRVRASWNWLAPYVPFVVLTVAYLALRYALFGEVAREGTLDAERLDLFRQNASIHLRRMVFGEPGLKLTDLGAAARTIAGVAAVFIAWILSRNRVSQPIVRPAVYFLGVWIALGLAPTVVAGYGSPRHMYLASVGWAIGLAIALSVFWHTGTRSVAKGLGVALATAILIAYTAQLRDEVRLWGVRAEVSRRVVIDLEREAGAAPAGTLFIVDPPPRSWNFALPYAARPPFTTEDVTSRVAIISHSSIHCCPANFWEPYTRRTITTWMQNPAHPPVVAMRWDPDTGDLFRLGDAEDRVLRALVPVLLEAKDVASLDRLILNITGGLVVKSSR
jgi:hypothetical protein